MCTDIGISKNTMTKLRKGEQKNINSQTAQKIADYFGVDVGVVVNGREETDIKKEPAANAADSLDVSMLTEEERGKVAAFMAGLISARQKL